MSEIIITKDNFDQEVLQAGKTVLLDFWASWCGPCRMMAPVVEEIAKERTDIVVGTVNVDEQSQLAEKFQIMTIPTLMVIKNGKVVKQVSGVRPNRMFWLCCNWKHRIYVDMK